MNRIEIKEQQYTVTSDAKFLTINVHNLILNKSCDVNYVLFDADNKFITSNTIVLDGADYDGWGLDDNYIQEWVLAKIGLTL